jgi:hypothetical protein
MRKGPGSVYDMWNISVVIFETDIRSGQPSYGGDRKILEVRTSALPKGTLGSVASTFSFRHCVVRSSSIYGF